MGRTLWFGTYFIEDRVRDIKEKSSCYKSILALQELILHDLFQLPASNLSSVLVHTALFRRHDYLSCQAQHL